MGHFSGIDGIGKILRAMSYDHFGLFGPLWRTTKMRGPAVLWAALQDGALKMTPPLGGVAHPVSLEPGAVLPLQEPVRDENSPCVQAPILSLH